MKILPPKRPVKPASVAKATPVEKPEKPMRARKTVNDLQRIRPAEYTGYREK